MFFTSDQWLALVRSILTWGGGILIARGIATQGLVNEALGALMTLAGVAWSIITHTPIPGVDPAMTAATAASDKPPMPPPSISTVAITPPPDKK